MPRDLGLGSGFSKTEKYFTFARAPLVPGAMKFACRRQPLQAAQSESRAIFGTTSGRGV